MEKLKRNVLYSQICVAERKQIDHFYIYALNVRLLTEC